MTDQHSGLEQTLHRDPSRLDLAGLVAARICHDLVSPLGAIGNGVELMQMTGGGAGPEADLIRESADTAAAKLRFLRLAFGAGGRTGMNLADAGRIASDHQRGTRANVRWEVHGTAQRAEVRLVLLAMLCIESAMATGGEIIVSRNGDRWQIDGAAEALRLEPSLWHALAAGRPPHDVDAARVHFAVFAEAARSVGIDLGVRTAPESVALSFPTLNGD